MRRRYGPTKTHAMSMGETSIQVVITVDGQPAHTQFVGRIPPIGKHVDGKRSKVNVGGAHLFCNDGMNTSPAGHRPASSGAEPNAPLTVKCSTQTWEMSPTPQVPHGPASAAESVAESVSSASLAASRPSAPPSNGRVASDASADAASPSVPPELLDPELPPADSVASEASPGVPPELLREPSTSGTDTASCVVASEDPESAVPRSTPPLHADSSDMAPAKAAANIVGRQGFT